MPGGAWCMHWLGCLLPAKRSLLEDINCPPQRFTPPSQICSLALAHPLQYLWHIRIRGMPAGPFLRRIPLQPLIPVPVILAADQCVCQLQSELLPCLCVLAVRPKAVPFLPYRLQVFSLWLVPPERLSHYYPALLCRHPFQRLQCPSMPAIYPTRPNAGHQIKTLRLLR